MSSDEAQLLQRAKEGDPAAFAEIYDLYQPLIYRYVSYRVDDAGTAEDLTGEVFVRLIEKIDRFTYRGLPLLAWLYTIARNLVADHHRHAGQSVSLALEEHLAADTTDPEEAADHTLMRRRLASAMAFLTEDQRQVISLKFVEDLDNAAVARILGKSVGAIKALQHRALAVLQRALEA
ncbi:MAG TPA: sigma-70 family RNA polymerase sigma factor [Anaerolineae bacterium]|nr:sigma-70 family RNA polymerase sigma factor [Anaerolineae bacterium]